MVDSIFEIFNQIVDVISGENSLIDFYYFLNDPFYGMLFLSLIIVIAYGGVVIYAIIFPKKKEETEQEKLERLIERWILDPSSFIDPDGYENKGFFPKKRI